MTGPMARSTGAIRPSWPGGSPGQAERRTREFPGPYFLAEAAFATPVPFGIDLPAAAPLTCAGVTTYKAVKVGNVRPGQGAHRPGAINRLSREP